MISVHNGVATPISRVFLRAKNRIKKAVSEAQEAIESGSPDAKAKVGELVQLSIETADKAHFSRPNFKGIAWQEKPRVVGVWLANRR